MIKYLQEMIYMNKKIGMFDSGIGGLTILKELKKLLPNEDYIYYADSKNNPYGEKSDTELMKIVTNIVDYLISRDVKIIVIACNTATTRCIKRLRMMYPDIPFVGTEPAIKVACDNNYKNTLVMATPGTIKAERTHELVKNYKRKGQKIKLLPCKGLADTIEFGTKKDVNRVLHNLLHSYYNKGIDSIVLGCTHYPYAKKNIQKLFPNAKLIDGNKGVSNQVKRVLKSMNLLNNKTEKGSEEIIYNK